MSRPMAYQPLRGQKALVTGANSGIGEGVARALAAAGAAVVVNYLTDAEAAQRIVSEISAGGVDVIAIRADVSREDEVQAMFRELLAAWGTIDILVNNAGLHRDAPFTEMTLEQWNVVLSVNLTGKDHLHLLRTGEDPLGGPDQLRRVQGRREAIHAILGKRAGATPDTGELDCSGSHPDAHQPRRH